MTCVAHIIDFFVVAKLPIKYHACQSHVNCHLSII